MEVRVFFWAPIQIQGFDPEFLKTRESGFLRFCVPEISDALIGIRLHPAGMNTNCIIRPLLTPQGALEKQYRLSLLQDFAMRQ
ncbi:hypothetical protein AB4P91_02670 [Pseudomonas sp. B21128]|uniref:hypothetical protein n=1 Tax=Pseudomonas TaxID=286 RepID=UPI0012421F21|nr:hypothetical protein [Pseudomonas fluorescens]